MIARRSLLSFLPFGLILGPSFANATTYFTGDTIKGALFPAATRFVPRNLTLTRQQMQAIAQATSVRVTSASIVAFDAYGPTDKQGTLIIDRVYGKHEFITFALALDVSGAVKGVEVMDYRESYGDQIRLPRWRAQFSGLRHGQPIRIDREIRNISGATLSCVHITEGVRRLLATYALTALRA